MPAEYAVVCASYLHCWTFSCFPKLYYYKHAQINIPTENMFRPPGLFPNNTSAGSKVMYVFKDFDLDLNFLP